MGASPLNICQFPFHTLEKIMASWNEGADLSGFRDAGRRPVVAHCIMAETDDEAFELTRTHLSEFFLQQSDHYEADSTFWNGIKGYEQFKRYFGNLLALSKPENIDKFSAHNFVGSAETVAGQVERLRNTGFNHIMVYPATGGIPRELRHDTLKLFAETVAPQFSSKFRGATAAPRPLVGGRLDLAERIDENGLVRCGLVVHPVETPVRQHRVPVFAQIGGRAAADRVPFALVQDQLSRHV